MSNSIYWCFTWNNPDYEAEQPNVWPDVHWGVWQHEVGASGTPHYQGYVVFTQKKRITWLHNNLPEDMHPDWKYDPSIPYRDNVAQSHTDRTAMPLAEIKRRQAINAAFVHDWKVTCGLKDPTYLMIAEIKPDEPEQAQLLRRWYNRQHK